MQQQIQVQKNELPQNDPISALPNNHQDFQIINDDEQIIQEDIMQNYEQDFDSISNDSAKQPLNNQIDQDFVQIQENIEEFPAKETMMKAHMQGEKIIFANDEDSECMKLQQQCQKMQTEISLFQQQLSQAVERQSDLDLIEQLIKAITNNEQKLRYQQAEKLAFFQNKVGKDSVCLHLLAQPEQYQEKVMLEIDKINHLIGSTSSEIAKLKRQTKKNEEALPLQQQNQEQFYHKFKKIKKQLQLKREKLQSQAQREQELQSKLQRLKQKYFQLQSSMLTVSQDSKQDLYQKIKIQYQQANKRKIATAKKNSLMIHQIKNNFQIITRSIQELRKQISEVEEGITTLQKKNIEIQVQCDKLMIKFEAKNKRIVKKLQQDHIQSNNSSRISQNSSSKPIVAYIKPRKKYFSQSKNSFVTNIFDNTVEDQLIQSGTANSRYIPPILPKDKSLSLTNQNQSISKGKLEQSPTANTLKQFKLKLPSHTPQKSTKNLNVSLDISKNTPNKQKTKTDQSKLSITQRLERIELLQKEDRQYSQKLYEWKRQEEERNLEQLKRELVCHPCPLIKDTNSTGDLPSYQKQMITEANETPNLLPSKTQVTIFQQTRKANEQLHLSPDISQAVQQKQKQSMTERKAEVDAETDYSQSALLTDRLHHKFFKKRIVYRQKKISEDYMRILQQRGRKILQLDNESQN